MGHDLLLKRLASNVSKQPNKLLFTYVSPGTNGGKIQRELTYEQVANETSKLAQMLLDVGLAKGDRYARN